MSSSTPSSEYWSNALSSRTSEFHVTQTDRNSILDLWDVEIASIFDQFTLARVRRNEFCLATTLPVELLARIFDFNVPRTCNDAPLDPNERREDGHGWAAVTYVCRTWRAAALAHATLWTTIDLGTRTLPLELLFERSRSAPVTVLGRNLHWSRVERVSNHLHRIRTLDLSHITGNDGMNKVMAAMDQAPAPDLRALALTGKAGSYHNFRNGDFLSSHSHNLRHIIFESIYFPWGLSFPNLRSLSLCAPHNRNFPFGGAPQPNTLFSDLLQALKNMPLLECLSLRRVFPPVVIDQNSIKVHLPHMRALTLLGSGPSCQMMLQFLSIPSSAAISLTSPGLVNYPPLLDDIVARIQASNVIKYTHIRIHGSLTIPFVHLTSGDYRPEFHVHPGKRHGVITDNRHGPELFLRLPGHNKEIAGNVVARLTSAAFAAHPLTSIFFKSGLYWDPWMTANALQHTDSLEHLSVSSPGSFFSYSILAALSSRSVDRQNDKTDGEEDSSLPTVRFPRLRLVTFESLEIHPVFPHATSADGYLGASKDVYGRGLVHPQAGEGINTLTMTFTQCTIPTDVVEGFTRIDGLEVEWDGIVDGHNPLGEAEEWGEQEIFEDYDWAYRLSDVSSNSDT